MDKWLLPYLLAGGLVLIASVFSSKATSKFGIPILLVFIIFGMLLGSDGIGQIHFSNHGFTRTLGTLCLIFILFSGGLNSPPNLIRPVWKESVMLSTVGVILTAGLVSVLVHLIMGWGWMESALVGAAISSTDAAAVFGILQSQKFEIKSRLRSVVEFESGSNDPMSVIMLTLLIQFVMKPHEVSLWQTFISFFNQVALGCLAGWFLGKALVKTINWLSLEVEGLYPVLTLASVIAIYSLTEYSGGNGFLSVFLAGFSMSGEKFLSRKSLMVFHDGFSWLMQVIVFLAVGLLVNPSELPVVVSESIILALSLIFLIRPIVVILCLAPFHYKGWRDIAFISWGGLKGVVPVILGTYLLSAKVPHAQIMFNIIFVIVIVSMALQGFTISKVSHWLGIGEERFTSSALEHNISATKTNEFIEFELKENSPLIGHTIFDSQLPPEVLVVLIHRDDEDFIPKGNTELKARDRLVCLTNKKAIPKIVDLLRMPKPENGEGRDHHSTLH